VRAGAVGVVKSERTSAPTRAKGPILLMRIMAKRYQGSQRGLRSGVGNTNSLCKLTGRRGGYMTIVTVYSRTGCHLCEDALKILDSMKDELRFELKEVLIDGDEELQGLYGEQIPVTHIDGVHHDYWRVDPERFRSSLEKHRQRQ
jgi:glutaredoxin